VLVFRKPLFTVIMAPMRKSRDDGSAPRSKTSRDVLSIHEKVKFLEMIEIEKNRILSLPGCTARMNFGTVN